MQIHTVVLLAITVLLLIHFIPDNIYDRYEFFISIIRGAAILLIISCIIVMIISFI